MNDLSRRFIIKEVIVQFVRHFDRHSENPDRVIVIIHSMRDR